jgi:acid phosphatase
MNHNTWEYFPEGTSVEQDFSTFPSGNFSSLPAVSFVIPNLNDNMHNGTIAQGDAWLKANIDSYAQWAENNNSLLIVTWDENDGTNDGNHVATILSGAHVVPGSYGAAYNHYNLLSTTLAPFGLTGPNNAAGAAPISVFK